MNNQKNCAHCGTSPVNHKFLFVLNLLGGFISKLDSVFLYFKSARLYNRAGTLLEKFLNLMLEFTGVVKYSRQIDKAVTGRSKLIWEEAERRGIIMEQMVILGKHIENYRANINGKFFHFQSLPIPDALPQEGYAWLDDKLELFKRLSENGIPAPHTVKVWTIEEAKNAFREMQKPVIVKPKSGSRGRHTTTNIQTEKDLVAAIRLARIITPSMVIQEHLMGSVYRATVINNKLVGFFRADPPQITGHEGQTIRELISEKNKNRPEKLSEILINDDLINFIKRHGYTLESEPPEGKTLDLSAKTGRMYGGYTREMLPEVHPKLHSIFEKAGEVVSAPVVGFDLIIPDPTLDPDTQRFGIIECNSLPYIDLHYFALEGTPINLARNVWDLWN